MRPVPESRYHGMSNIYEGARTVVTTSFLKAHFTESYHYSEENSVMKNEGSLPETLRSHRQIRAFTPFIYCLPVPCVRFLTFLFLERFVLFIGVVLDVLLFSAFWSPPVMSLTLLPPPCCFLLERLY